jgi:hypothetical protein
MVVVMARGVSELLESYLVSKPSNSAGPRRGDFPFVFHSFSWRARRDLLTPRFVGSIGRVLDSRLIPDDRPPPRNETMGHEPDRHSPALDFESSRLNRMRIRYSGGCVPRERPRDRNAW